MNAVQSHIRSHSLKHFFFFQLIYEDYSLFQLKFTVFFIFSALTLNNHYCWCISFSKVDIQPPERETIFSDELRPSDPRNVGPCGGFSKQYACMCDYYSVPYRLAWINFNFIFLFEQIIFCSLPTLNDCNKRHLNIQ